MNIKDMSEEQLLRDIDDTTKLSKLDIDTKVKERITVYLSSLIDELSKRRSVE